MHSSRGFGGLKVGFQVPRQHLAVSDELLTCVMQSSTISADVITMCLLSHCRIHFSALADRLSNGKANTEHCIV